MTEHFKNTTPTRTRFGLSPAPRWETEDGIEVVRAGVDRYLAQRADGASYVHTGLTREEAVRLVREAPRVTDNVDVFVEYARARTAAQP